MFPFLTMKANAGTDCVCEQSSVTVMGATLRLKGGMTGANAA
jgi:hypothetical protein